MSQLTSKAKSVNTRDQVMASALRLFTGQGYFNTSIPDIVKDSGISTGSIYHHFGDKEGIAKLHNISQKSFYYNKAVQAISVAKENLAKSSKKK